MDGPDDAAEPGLSRRAVIAAGGAVGLVLGGASWLTLGRRPDSPDGWARPSPSTATAGRQWSVPIVVDVTSGVLQHKSTVFACDPDGIAYAIEVGSGKTLWKQNTGFSAFHQLIFDDRVYVVSGGGLRELGDPAGVVAYSSLDGSLLWRHEYPILGVLAAVSGHLLLGDGDGNLFRLEPAGGRQVWHTPMPSDFVHPSGIRQIAVGGDIVFSVLRRSNRSRSADLTGLVLSDVLLATGAAAGDPKWRVDANTQLAEKPSRRGSDLPWISTQLDGLVHVMCEPNPLDTDDPVTIRCTIAALDAASGRIVWRFDSYSITQPLLAREAIYLLSMGPAGDRLQAHALDPRTGAVRWSHVIGADHEILFGAPEDNLVPRYFGGPNDFAANQRVVCVSSISGILALDAGKGTKLWSARANAGTGPVLAGNVVHLGRGDLGAVARWRASDGRELPDVRAAGTSCFGLYLTDRLLAVTDSGLHALPLGPDPVR